MTDVAQPGECGVEDLAGSEFVAGLIEPSPGVQAYPLGCTLEITEQCNLACRHCYLGQRRNASEVMSLPLAGRVFERLARGGVLVLTVTGGEPLLHPEFRELWAAGREQGFLLTLMTNAVMVDDDIVAFLAAQRPRRVEVTVYGASADTYARVTGDAAAFHRCRAGVEALGQAGVTVQIKVPVLRDNAGDLGAIRAWAASLGMPFRSDKTLFPTLDGSQSPLECGVEGAGRMTEVRPCGGHGTAVTCGAGLRTMHVDVRGQAHPCVMWRPEPCSLEDVAPDEWTMRMQQLRGRR